MIEASSENKHEELGMTRKQALVMFLVSAAGQANAAVVKGVDFRDAFGGLMGLAAVFFFMFKCFQGDKNPPAPGFMTNKREERKLTGDSGASMEVEAE
jgi:hypothetical protein